MAASNEWFEYHLTPSGWETGSSKTDFAYKEKRPPNDRVLTIRISEYVSSHFSPLDRSEEELWRSSDAASVEALITKFGASPL